ncbi:MAG TPA: response regulator [Vicinamibacterales bacterium]
MRVLVADDDDSTMVFLSRAIIKLGYEPITATDGEAAWDALETLAPPLAIVDWMMPKLDGLELCRRIRESPRFANMYILLLTGRTGRKDVVRGLEAGADDYLKKPVDLHELGARLKVGARVMQATDERERLLDSMTSILIQSDSSGRIVRWNAAAQRTFGVPASVAIGKTLATCGVDWTDPAFVESLMDHSKLPARIDDVSFIDSSGNTRLIGLTMATLKREGAAPDDDGFVAFGADVTNRRTLEAQLRQAQKLESVGQLAAGIAHEINTPMQYVSDNVRFLQDACDSMGSLFERLTHLHQEAPPSGDTSTVEAIRQEVDRVDLAYLQAEIPGAIRQTLEGLQHVSRIVKAMKDFSHPGTDTKVPIDLNRAIETTLIVAQNELKYVADTTTVLDPDLPLVPCLPGEINQVLLNLLINAAHAIGDSLPAAGEAARGRITVTTRHVDGEVEISVTDTGTGIPEGIRRRVFEPFFTTKVVGRGTGQGLALAHSVVVNRHAGRIWFDTECNKGTTFFVRLPVETDDAANDQLIG